jgi:hypothetical protein
MFTIFTNTRNSNLYIIMAVTITLVVLFTFAVAPSITVPRPAIIPVTGSQNAYVDFLRGEKAMYMKPVRLSDALSAYRAGEKAIHTNAVDLSDALSAYHLGEKNIATNPEAALLIYRRGEKDIK